MIPLRDKKNSMKASKFTEAQIAFVLKQAEDGTPVMELCRKAGISDATLLLPYQYVIRLCSVRRLPVLVSTGGGRYP